MRWLLMLVVLLAALSNLLGIDFGLAPGLSAKNLLLYAGAAFIIVNAILLRNVPFSIPRITMAFVTLVTYALLTFVLLAFVSRSPGYEWMQQAITLKSNLIDYLVYFLVFFYGLQNKEEALRVLKFTIAVVAMVNLITVLNVAGITNIGEVAYGNNDDYEGGRIHGAFGHANETGALIVVLLPLYIAAAQRGVTRERVFWIILLLASLGMLLLTGSRGSLVGLFLGGAVGLWIVRNYLDRRRFVTWSLWTVAAIVPALAVFGGQYWQMLVGRVVSQSVSSAGEASSGRTDLWWEGLSTMADAPYSFLTGLGWGTWNLHGFIFVAHNHYLWTFFELGLIGIVCFLGIILGPIAYAASQLRGAEDKFRPYMVGFVVGLTTLVVSMFFENIYTPWPYIWPVIGLVMRLALPLTPKVPSQREASIGVVRAPIGKRDPRARRVRGHDA